MKAIGNPASSKGSLTYYVAICVIAAFGGFLFGFDTAVISGAISPLSDYFNLGNNPGLLGWTVSSVLLGSVLGAALSGFADTFGRKINSNCFWNIIYPVRYRIGGCNFPILFHHRAPCRRTRRRCCGYGGAAVYFGSVATAK